MVLSNYQLSRDIIALEPLEVKNVVIRKAVWLELRPVIKKLQSFGLWYDISEYGNKLYLRCKVNEIIQNYIEKQIERIDNELTI